VVRLTRRRSKSTGQQIEESAVLINRTMGSASVVPELVYDDVGKAVDWLCETFGFTEVWRAGNHRARVRFGNGIVVVADADAANGRQVPEPGESVHTHSTMVQVEDADAHHEHARQRGARIVSPPADYGFGERQYTVEDLGGHRWTFSQSIADLAPESWGGTSKTV
jgi:uncharacterized glyoxalase superfamily protein PhnB